MKRIVYSIFTENLKEHISASNFKKQQFIKYKDKIISCQKNMHIIVTLHINYLM